MQVRTAIILCAGVLLATAVAFAAPVADLVAPQQQHCTPRTVDPAISDNFIVAPWHVDDSPADLTRSERSSLDKLTTSRTTGVGTTSLPAAAPGRLQYHCWASASSAPLDYRASTSLFSLYCKLAI